MNKAAGLPLSEKSSLIQQAYARLKNGEWLGPLIISCVFLFMLFMGWRRSGDLLVDFGRELYVPWRIVEGDALYADIAYFNGPLSPYLNSVWFRLFGPNITTLLIANLFMLTGLAVILFRTLSNIADRHSASIAAIVFIAVFALGHLDLGYLDGASGNYNYLTPYSHEMTHGVAFAFLALFLVMRAPYWRKPIIALVGSGFCFGLVFLTKPEIFLALGAAMPVAIVSFVLKTKDQKYYSMLSVIGIFVLAAFLPPALGFVLLQMAMPSEVAVRGVLGAWYWIFNRDVLSFAFYNNWMGLDDITGNLWQLFLWTGRYAFVLAPALIFSFLFGHKHKLIGAFLGLMPLILFVYWVSKDPEGLARPLPLVMVVLIGFCLSMVWHVRDDVPLLSRKLFLLALVVFATFLLTKMMLFSRIRFYGFVLAMPATMLSVLLLIRWIPVSIEKAGGNGQVFRVAGLGMVSVILFAFIGVSYVAYRNLKSLPVAQGANKIYADRMRAPLVNAALREIAMHTDKGSTLCVFPRGMMLNFIAKRPCASPYFDFPPFELFLYGEEKVLKSLKARPPDYVMLVHLPMYAEKLPFFGRDYGHQIDEWIRLQYRPVRLFGTMPFQGENFGMLLMRRSDFTESYSFKNSRPAL